MPYSSFELPPWSGRFCVAPMLGWTDRHCRYFHRLFTKYSRLYTEMACTDAILKGSKHLIEFDNFENPLALQIAGKEPKDLASCVKIAQIMGYKEVNLNLGCPSSKVQNGKFGACLMYDIAKVKICVQAMCDVASVPISVKMRTGVDDYDSYEWLASTVHELNLAGCQQFIIHARKAYLKGLNPKQNRSVPPIRYDKVYRLKKEFPRLKIILNGGITSIEQAQNHLKYVDGVMMGREAYQNPSLLRYVDSYIFQKNDHPVSLDQILERFKPYVYSQLNKKVRLCTLVRPMLGLFKGMPGSRKWRRHLSDNAWRKDANWEVVQDAFRHVSKEHKDYCLTKT